MCESSTILDLEDMANPVIKKISFDEKTMKFVQDMCKIIDTTYSENMINKLGKLRQSENDYIDRIKHLNKALTK